MRYLCRAVAQRYRTTTTTTTIRAYRRLGTNRYAERQNCTGIERTQFRVTGHWEHTLRPFYNAATNRIARRTPRPVRRAITDTVIAKHSAINDLPS